MQSKESQLAVCAILEDFPIEVLHEVLVRNGWHLPGKGGHWLTKKVMLAMYRYEIYCPSYLDLKPRPCPRPPQRAVLVEEINKEIVRKFASQAKCLVTSPNRMPELQWLLDALSSLNPDH